MCDYLLTVAGKIVNDRNLNHCIGSGLLLHAGTGCIDHHLGCEGWIVDAHVELEELVVCGSTHTLTHQIDTMAHIIEIGHAGHLLNMRLVVHEIRVGLHCGFNRLEIYTFFQFDIHHAAMNASTHGNGHTQCIPHTLNGTHGHAVSHTASGAAAARLVFTICTCDCKQYNGDTCYSRSEDHKVYNPNGKEIIARENEISARRHEEGFEAYFNCHTDITIPYDEIAEIVVVDKYENMIPIIRDGRFVLDGTEALNIPLNKD